jgi:hypothetical protein
MSAAAKTAATPAAGDRTGNTRNTGSLSRNWRTSGARNNRRVPRTSTTNATNTFKGTVTEMNGHVFQCYGEAIEKNQFARTVEELDSYVGLHFKYHPADIKKMIKNMEDTVVAVPDDHDSQATKTVIHIWERKWTCLSSAERRMKATSTPSIPSSGGNVPKPCKPRSSLTTPTTTCTKKTTVWN